MKITKLLASILIGLSLTNIQAQQTTVASGGMATSTNGNISYSIGQIAYLANSSPAGSATQGVQQPYEIYTLSATEFDNAIKLTFSAYPNPTTDFLTLKISDFTNDNLAYQIFDVTGKLIKSNKINSTETNINMENIPIAIYFFKITSNNKEVKTFKIIKN